MIIPTAVSTVAAALNIIDYVFKFANYLSPETKQSLDDTRKVLKQVDGQQPAQIADTVLADALRKHIDTSTFEVESRILTAVFGIIQALTDGLALQRDTVPRYANALNEAFRLTLIHFNSWNVLQYQGRRVNVFFETTDVVCPDYRYIVSAPHVARAFQKCPALVSRLADKGHDGIFYFYYPTGRADAACYLITTGETIDFFPFENKWHQMVSDAALKCTGVVFQEHGYDLHLLTRTGPLANDRTLEVYKLSIDEFEHIANGLMADALHYARFIHDQRQQAQDILKRLGSNLPD